ncbi:MAG TPA: carbamoyltransferase HypF [Kofleriaceae bacterium]|nr:carbamoyltransferase HypF [Kofleriaceae bacterium]
MMGLRIEVRGTVQGVGFRPWVYRLARELGVVGRVRNHAGGVTIDAFAGADILEALVARLQAEAPAPARVREVTTAPLEGPPRNDFVIEHSATAGARALSIPPDLATCPACLAEVDDPANRRAGYAFTNCTACGPRFTIATGVPYDRAATTMAGFRMCPDCQAEYDDPGDRRFHAQPDACPVCGPRLALWDGSGRPIVTGDPLAAAVARLRADEIVAIKGLGGYHLACDATSSAAVAALRARKHRDHKPFAVMVADLDAARALAELEEAEAAALVAPERPIVLVRRRAAARAFLAQEAQGGEGRAPGGDDGGAPVIADGVAPDTDLLGVMLAYTPLHHRLAAAVGRPLVMTSGNRADEPIVCDDAQVVARLGDIATSFLVHDRPIANRCDDSVARVIDGAPTLLRRSRGWVPRPIALAEPVPQPILAVGGQLKNTFCLAVGDRAYLGPHIGDLDQLPTLEHFEDALARMAGLLQVHPEVIAHDLHPDYLSTRWARGQAGARTIGVQHHHAHVASAIAEHGLRGPVIGVAFDGTGWGPDGTAWGSEVLLATAGGYQRLATFRPIALAGGEAAIRNPWRIALALLDDALGGATGPLLGAIARTPLFAKVPAGELAVVRRMLRTRLNVAPARGVGRYFDGVAALAHARAESRYEGQLAMAWNAIAAAGDHPPYPWAIERGEAHAELDLRAMVRAIVADVSAGVPAPILSARFHATLVAATAEAVRAAVATHGRLPVVLTGGAFANPILASGLTAALRELDVRRHREVPPGDGGLALGQAVVAAAALAREGGR